MSQTKRKVKIRQHIAQLHIKTQAVNCPNFKQKKAEPRNLGDFGTANKQKPETKTVQELIELVCLRCSGSGHVPTQETANAILKSKWISEAKHRKGLVEKDKQIKRLNGKIGKLANDSAYDTHDKRLDYEAELKRVEKLSGIIAVLEGENAKLRERLEAIKAHYERRGCYTTRTKNSGVWMEELGVLLSTKGLDQKTREGDIK